MRYKKLFEVAIMNIKLKSFDILRPKVNVKAGMKTIARDITGIVHSPNIRNAYALTQAEYDALPAVEENALYFIVEGE